MSHFTVAVVLPEYTKEALEQALQPFHEYECTGVKDKYVIKVECPDKINDYKTETLPCVIDKESGELFGTRYGEEVSPFWNRKGFGISSADELILPDNLVEKDLPATEVYPTLEDYLSDWCGIDVDGDSDYSLEEGKLYTYTNPNAKWDWWQIGGRWCGHFNMKPKYNMLYDDNALAREKGYSKGERSWTNKDEMVKGYDIIKKCDIDLETGFQEKFDEKLKHFEIYLEVAKQFPEYKTWDEVYGDDNITNTREVYWSQPILVELGKRLKEAFPDQYGWESPKPETFCFGEYDAYKNKIRYQTFGTYAILTDGEWMQKGEMGWFGCDTNVNGEWETKWFEIFNSIPDDHWIVVVDCHI